MNRLHSLRLTLQEANDYYNMTIQAVGGLNMDRIGYTSTIKLEAFREILQRPDLTSEELSSLLRSARNEVWSGIDTESLEIAAASISIDIVDTPYSGRKPDARVPKPVVPNIANDPGHDWASLMARIVMNRANEEDAIELARRRE